MSRPTCYHEKKNVVWTRVNTHGESLAVRQLRHQCQDCGRLLADALPHSKATPDTPDVDMEALQRWAEYDKLQWTRGREERNQLAQQRNDEWRFRYEEYLQSDNWMIKRDLVFERSGGICEECRQNRATAVHHLTYDHMGDELLWELAAVCRNCHEKAHNIK